MSERRAQSWPMRVFGLLSRMNYAIALIGGVVLLATVIFILVDILPASVRRQGARAARMRFRATSLQALLPGASRMRWSSVRMCASTC